MQAALRFSQAIFLAALLSACGVLGLQQPKDFGDRWEYAQRHSIAVRDTATASLDAGLIDVETAQWVKSVADKADEGLDLARMAYRAGDYSTAEGRLQLALAVLNEFESRLTESSRKQKVPPQ